MKYRHDKQTAAEIEQVKRYRQNHRINAAGTLAPAIDWKDIAELAVKQPQLVSEFLPGLTTKPVHVWPLEGAI